MQIDGSLYDLSNDKCWNILRQPLSLPDVLIQIFAVNVLSNDVDMGLASNCFLVFNDLRMRYYLHDLALII
jgi:hypothetical protein